MDNLDYNGNAIVILISKIVSSSSNRCDLDFVANTHKEAEG